VRIVHAATAGPDAPGGDLLATGGRVLNVVAVGSDFTAARRQAYDAMGRIGLDGAHFRTDIAGRVAK
jgi:phosphoribosylamine--glycine ligase